MAVVATPSPSEPSEALVEQLSFYFTDANLRRDRFMKTFTGADGTGKMPVETLATFNRVKALTQDVGTIVAALRLIPGLQVSDPSDQEGHTIEGMRESVCHLHDFNFRCTELRSAPKNWLQGGSHRRGLSCPSVLLRHHLL